MNIEKEINLLVNNEKKSGDILLDLLNEEKDLENKIHIFRVLQAADQYQELIDKGLFNKNRIFSGVFDLSFYKKGKYHSLDLKDENGNNINKEDIDKDIYEHLEYWNNGISESKTKYGSNSNEFNLMFDHSFKEKFIDFMLSIELKSILNATINNIQLEKEMPINNGKVVKQKL
jgi:hypothetical protein